MRFFLNWWIAHRVVRMNPAFPYLLLDVVLLLVVGAAIGWFFGSGHGLRWPFEFSFSVQSPVVPN